MAVSALPPDPCICVYGFSEIEYTAGINLIDQVLKSVPGFDYYLNMSTIIIRKCGFDYGGVSWSFFIQVSY
jgi:hypothetical protein